jgi:hypothetical protein
VPGEGLSLDRVVAVLASFADGGQQVGSGYLIGAGRVVTAEHATRDRRPGSARVVTGLEVIRFAFWIREPVTTTSSRPCAASWARCWDG